MGQTMSDMIFGKKNKVILMSGLNGAGKTTVLYTLHIGEIERTMTTTGFNVEQLDYKNISYTVWDFNHELRPKWRQHFDCGLHGLIYVVDSCNRESMKEAREDLARMVYEHEDKNPALLIFANKQDSDNPMSVDEIIDELDLNNIRILCHVQSASAKKGRGLREGLDWLTDVLNKKK